MNCVNGALEVCDSGLSGCSSGLVQHLRKMQNIFRNPFSVLDYWRISMDFNHHLCRTSTCCDMLCHSVMCSFLQLFVVARFGTLVFFLLSNKGQPKFSAMFFHWEHSMFSSMGWTGIFLIEMGSQDAILLAFEARPKFGFFIGHIYIYIHISHRIHVFNIW